VAYEAGARDVTIHSRSGCRRAVSRRRWGGVTYRLDEDDCLATQLDQPTTYRNRTRKPARYLVVVASERARAPRR
jgi:hypothetical protein